MKILKKIHGGTVKYAAAEVYLLGKRSHFLKWEYFPIESILVYGYSIMIVLNVLACCFGSDAINKKIFF